MTEGDKRWIKRHTEKTLKELNMRKTKTRPAKKTVAHTKNPIVGKLLRLKYRMNEAYHLNGVDTKDDKRYVMSLISDTRKHGFTKLAPEDVHCCNGLWRKYE